MVKSPISHTSITGFFVALNPCLFVSNIVSLSHYRKKVIHMNQKLRNLVYTAMLMALCCVATLVIKIPTVTGGYLNAGDSPPSWPARSTAAWQPVLAPVWRM